jgi:uncharacterized protein
MLHSYRFSNVYSFREEAAVSLLLSQREPASDWWAQDSTDQRTAKVMAVIGPNASGKTSLLNALAFIHWFITASFAAKPEDLLPFQSHAASDATAPSSFEVELSADLDGMPRLWRYRLKATRSRVIEESLHVRHERERFVFVRTWQPNSNTYVVKEQGFGHVPLEAVNGRPNASLIALGAQYGLPLAQKIIHSSYLRTNITEIGKERTNDETLMRAASHFAAEEAQKTSMVGLLKNWDLGLQGIVLREIETTATDGSTKKVRVPWGVHAMRTGGLMELNFRAESSGTQMAFVLLSRLLPVLHGGGIAVIDEFESDMHPHMLAPILDLFANPATNQHHAQLLFTSHSMEVLNLLPKSQVILVEKDEFNESQAWRLDEVKGVRSDDNFYAKYMAGAYGAVPRL